MMNCSCASGLRSDAWGSPVGTSGHASSYFFVGSGQFAILFLAACNMN
jgi:hypothetical protein